jgi:hypothetical protein
MEIGCGDESLGYQVFRSCDEGMVWDGLGLIWRCFSFYASLLLHRKPELLPCQFSYLLELSHLKLHIVGDVNLSHSLGIIL